MYVAELAWRRDQRSFVHGVRELPSSRGDLYVSEVVYAFATSGGLSLPDCHTLQKFVRERSLALG